MEDLIMKLSKDHRISHLILIYKVTVVCLDVELGLARGADSPVKWEMRFTLNQPRVRDHRAVPREAVDTRQLAGDSLS